jgi:murein DD-endopeptidase MepM/ murein hydrolase activator NlpD
LKNRLIITVSDVNGTKSYNIHQLVKKLAIIITIVAIIVISGSIWLINYLNIKMDNLKIAKEKEIEILTLKENELITQNKLHAMKIKDKIKDIEELSSKLDDIEEIIGVKKVDEANPITRAQLAKITSSERIHMLRLVPNGSPLKKTKITAKFGYRIHPITKKRKFHRGIDLKAKRRTPIYVTADGVVRFVQSKNKGAFGRVVIVSHNYGFETVYAHLYKTKVKVGDVVKKGDLIALSGNSGRSTGPHLHYEVKYASRVLNPWNFIRWDLKNYENIFNKERRVKWESLVSLINQHKKNQVQQ